MQAHDKAQIRRVWMMRQFKKKMMAGLLLVAMTLCTLGTVTPADAATLSAKQYLVKMDKVTAKAKSYEMTQTTTLKMSSQGQDMTLKTTSKQIVFQNPIKAKAVATSTIKGAGMDSSSKVVTYLKEDSKGNVSQYISIDGSDYEETDVTELYETADNTKANEALYASAKIVKKSVKVNKINTVQISAKLTGDAMADTLAQLGISGEDMEALGVDFSTLKPIKVTIWIDKKTYQPVKMTTDMKDFLKSYTEAMYKEMGVDSTDSYSTAKTTTTYKNFNKAKKFSFPKF